MFTYAYGFPRLGKDKRYKKHIEDFWRKTIGEQELISKLNDIEEERISFYKKHINLFPLGELTYYDNVLDTALIFGIYQFKNLNEYFAYGRGKKSLELKKYFNSNYHYLVPHITKKIKFKITWNKPLFYFNTFFSFKDNPVFLIGPYTFLKLSHLQIDFEEAFNRLCEVYSILLEQLKLSGIHSLHLEEPSFVLDVPYKEVKMIKKNYSLLLRSGVKINLITYYESLPFIEKLYDLPFNSLGLDFIAGENNLKIIKKKGFAKDTNLICGVLDGKNPRRSDIFRKVKVVESIRKISKLDYQKLLISNSCPLYHLPVTLDNETSMESRIINKISFAKEKLYELYLIKKVLSGQTQEAQQWCKFLKNEMVIQRRKTFDTLSLKDKEFLERRKLHKKIFNLPLFPTTTIGSFPQDTKLRKIRLKFKRNSIKESTYNNYIKAKIKKLIKFQEGISLDVLVHGEFERSDMVEFFAQKLKGFATTQQGWVISYGTRVYRPPIIYEEIKRKRPITVKEISYAQAIAKKPVKGIFTGPVTIIAWSYNLRQEPLYRIAFELAKVLNDEAKELINHNIKFIQIDEPAIKEFAPLKKEKWNSYFSWAIRAFNLVAKLPREIQIHTHMCYSEFYDIIKWILKMNFDVISIEAAREGAKIIDAFKGIKFPKQIGPGVWDIHSKYPAKKWKVKQILNKAINVFGKEKIWLNPDCGLKTRDWPEVISSLQTIVNVAKTYRNKYKC